MMKKTIMIFTILLLMAANLSATDVLWLRKGATLYNDSILVNLLQDNLGYTVHDSLYSSWPFTLGGNYDLVIVSGLSNLYWSDLIDIEDSAQSASVGFLSLGTANSNHVLRTDLRLGDSIRDYGSQIKVYTTDSSHWITSEEIDTVYIFDADSVVADVDYGGKTLSGVHAFSKNGSDVYNLINLYSDSTDISFLCALDDGGTNADGNVNTGRNVFIGFCRGDVNVNRTQMGWCAMTRLWLRACAWAANDTVNTYFETVVCYDGPLEISGGWTEVGTTAWSRLYTSNWRYGVDPDPGDWKRLMMGFYRADSLLLRIDTATKQVDSCNFIIPNYSSGIDDTDSCWEWWAGIYLIKHATIWKSPPRRDGGDMVEDSNWFNRLYAQYSETTWADTNLELGTDMVDPRVYHFECTKATIGTEILVPIDSRIQYWIDTLNNGLVLKPDSFICPEAGSDSCDVEMYGGVDWGVQRTSCGGQSGAKPLQLWVYLSDKSTTYPDTLVACALDSFRCDYSGENDSLQIIYTTGAENWPDQVVFSWSISAYPDSNGADTMQYVYAASTTDTVYIADELTETYTLYLSAWVMDADSGWSARKQRSVQLTEVTASKWFFWKE